MPHAQPRRVVFIGPSISLRHAEQTLPGADFRPPIKRGDLDEIAPGTVVGIVDGLFAQNLAISPGEIREAIDNGVTVYGASSMGALRAAEVPSVVGVGRIFEMYRTGVIERDDEVAVLINPITQEALTEPLVNVRFAVERLVRSGTLNHGDGAAIVEACIGLHYTERTYQQILGNSKLARNRDVDDIIRLLRTFNLKRDDAQLLLETLATAQAPPPRSSGRRAAYVQRSAEAYERANTRECSAAPVMVWESGDSVRFADLVRFLKVTGGFEAVARNVIGRLAAAGTLQPPAILAESDDDPEHRTRAAQSLLDGARAQWGWETPEESHVTMRDLGLGLDDVADLLEAEVGHETARQLARDRLAGRLFQGGPHRALAARSLAEARGSPPGCPAVLRARGCRGWTARGDGGA